MVIRSYLYSFCLCVENAFVPLPLLQDGEIKLYNPFGFNCPFPTLITYVNKDNYSNDELNKIVRHELVHAQQNIQTCWLLKSFAF